MRYAVCEGGPMPWLYHKYAAHDLNRDAFMMNLPESRNLARFFYGEWHPQVFLSMHQMGGSGPRMFVPPVLDPIDRNYDPLIWREAALLGGAMALDLQRDGRAGVVSSAIYDYYWPGYEDSAPLGHNTVCLLTEVAGVKIATPTDVPVTELRGQKGVLPDTPQINFPDPWPGGRWTLRDIVDYDLSAVHGLLHAVAAYRERIVQNFYDMGRRAIEDGQRTGPFAFVVPPDQFDPHAVAKLEELLLQGGIEIHRALDSFQVAGGSYPAGSDIVPLAQPYRAYVKTLLERQDYPVRRATPNTPPERPYDVAGWTLPAQMGVDVRTIQGSFDMPPLSRVITATAAPARLSGDGAPDYYVVDARGNGGALAVNRLVSAGAGVSWLTGELDAYGYRYAVGSLVVAHSDIVRPVIERIAAELGLRTAGVKGKIATGARPVGTARVALYKPWMENADEGWTRWLLEEYEFHFTSVNDAQIRAGDLRKRYDAIILPTASAEQLRYGNPAGVVPPEYVGGLAEAGVAALRSFVEAGGTLICLDQAGGLAIEEFKLPLRDTAHEIGNDEFFCPGSILRIELDPLNPRVLWKSNPQLRPGFFAFSSAHEIPRRDRIARGRRRQRRGRRAEGPDHRAIRAPGSAGQRLDRGGIRDRRPGCRRGSQPRRGPHRAARIPRPASRPVARNVPPPVQLDLHGNQIKKPRVPNSGPSSPGILLAPAPIGVRLSGAIAGRSAPWKPATGAAGPPHCSQGADLGDCRIRQSSRPAEPGRSGASGRSGADPPPALAA